MQCWPDGMPSINPLISLLPRLPASKVAPGPLPLPPRSISQILHAFIGSVRVPPGRLGYGAVAAAMSTALNIGTVLDAPVVPSRRQNTLVSVEGVPLGHPAPDPPMMTVTVLPEFEKMRRRVALAPAPLAIVQRF